MIRTWSEAEAMPLLARDVEPGRASARLRAAIFALCKFGAGGVLISTDVWALARHGATTAQLNRSSSSSALGDSLVVSVCVWCVFASSSVLGRVFCATRSAKTNAPRQLACVTLVGLFISVFASRPCAYNVLAFVEKVMFVVVCVAALPWLTTVPGPATGGKIIATGLLVEAAAVLNHWLIACVVSATAADRDLHCNTGALDLYLAVFPTCFSVLLLRTWWLRLFPHSTAARRPRSMLPPDALVPQSAATPPTLLAQVSLAHDRRRPRSASSAASSLSSLASVDHDGPLTSSFVLHQTSPASTQFEDARSNFGADDLSFESRPAITTPL